MIEIFAELCRVELLLFLIRISYTDLRYQKILNWEIYFQFIGETISIMLFKNINLFQFICRLLLPIIILIIPYLYKGIGAGDIKVYMLISILLNKKDFLFVLWISLVLGILEYVLINFIKRSKAKKRVLSVTFKKLVEQNRNRNIICIGPCIALSLVIWSFTF